MRLFNYIRITLIILAFSLETHAVPPTCTSSGVTATQLAQRIQGDGITITNPVLRRGNEQQAGLFTNGLAAGLELNEGIILTGMSVAESCTTNNNWNTSINNTDITPDPNLLAIDTKARYDTVVFEFDVTLGANTRLLMLDYQFASDEYNEYVGSQFNDAFGFFISGGDLTQTYNVARVVDDSTIVTTANIFNYDTVTVNNVNNGSLGTYADGTATKLTNTQYFINNCKKGTGVPNCTQTTPPVEVEYDGLTHRLHATLDNLTPGMTYHFKMAIADTGDSSWDTGVFVNKIQGIRGPQLCYDYAYKQNDRYITNKSYLGQIPRIDSNVFPNIVVPVSIYIRNLETSELTALNLKMNINDINTTQAIYQPNSISLIKPNSIVSTPLTDNSNGMSVDDSYIHNAPIGNLGSAEYFYFTYGLMPITNDLDMLLNATVSFDLSIQGVTIPYLYTLGSDKLPMCTGTATYSASPGIYNIVDSQLNTTTLNQGSTNVKYNLPTQVASRPTEMKIVSFDPNNLNSVKSTNTIMAVELIDVGGYFDTNASCYDPSSAITQRVWVKFGDYDNNITNTNFNSSLFGIGMNSNVSSTDFYAQVRENMAYRLSYNLDDNNGSIQVDEFQAGKYKLTNFTTYAGQPCASDIDGNPNSNDTVPQWCGSNGTGGGTGMSASELRTCMECIYGLKTKRLCSRDNFSTRPEAFQVTLQDPAGGGIMPYEANLSAEYMYQFDANATNHIDNTPTSGYTAWFSNTATDRNVTLSWEPNGRVVSGCNDTVSPLLDFYFLNGKIIAQNRNHNNVGRYELRMRDSLWTAVDQSPAHHDNTTNWISGNDCANGSGVPVYSPSNSYTDNLVGCTISSNHNKLSTPTATFNDYNLTFRPNSFAFGTGTQPFINGLGKTAAAIAAGGSGFVYDSDLANVSDMNMSVRLEGIVQAVGANGGELSNFVNDCYASNLNFTLSHNANVALATPFVYRMINKDASNITTQMYDSGKINFNVTPLMSVDDGNFSKNGRGKMYTEIRVNYDRNAAAPLNPQNVLYNDLGVSCADVGECRYQANGIVDVADGNNTLNFNVAHYYGRAQGIDSRISVANNATNAVGNVRVGFEVFCGNDGATNCNPTNLVTPLTLPSGRLAPMGEDRNWFKNLDHNTTVYGAGDLDGVIPTRTANTDITVTQTTHNINGVSFAGDILGFQRYGASYNGNQGYPHRAIMRNIPEGWLIYNIASPGATFNEFSLEFNREGAWVGKSSTETSSDSDAAINSSRRIMW